MRSGQLTDLVHRHQRMVGTGDSQCHRGPLPTKFHHDPERVLLRNLADPAKHLLRMEVAERAGTEAVAAKDRFPEPVRHAAMLAVEVDQGLRGQWPTAHARQDLLRHHADRPERHESLLESNGLGIGGRTHGRRPGVRTRWHPRLPVGMPLEVVRS